MVDIEASGSTPGFASLLSIGAVVVDENVGGPKELSFYTELKPLPEAEWSTEAAQVHGLKREELLFSAREPADAMWAFKAWLGKLPKRPQFWADTGGFDWMFVDYYFKRFVGSNPFGFTARDARAWWMGVSAVNGSRATFADLRPCGMHNHNALEDARANAIAFNAGLEQVAAFKRLRQGAKLTLGDVIKVI